MLMHSIRLIIAGCDCYIVKNHNVQGILMETKILLLVEDNPDDEVMTVRALTRSRVCNRIVVAHDGVEALDYLFGSGAYSHRDTSLQPQLVLLDLMMPKIDGMEVLRRLRADPRTEDLPVVILTSSQDQQDYLASTLMGVDSFMRKPIDFDQLCEVVRQLGLSLLLTSTPPRRQ